MLLNDFSYILLQPFHCSSRCAEQILSHDERQRHSNSGRTRTEGKEGLSGWVIYPFDSLTRVSGHQRRRQPRQMHQRQRIR
jgi:hypothetical protein